VLLPSAPRWGTKYKEEMNQPIIIGVGGFTSDVGKTTLMLSVLCIQDLHQSLLFMTLYAVIHFQYLLIARMIRIR
jgi:hypothetical protein